MQYGSEKNALKKSYTMNEVGRIRIKRGYTAHEKKGHIHSYIL